MAESLSMEQITGLLNLEKRKTQSAPQPSKAAQALDRPIQVGPLRYVDQDGKCASRGCSSPCRIRVVGIPYCSTHALYALNEHYMKLEGKYVFDDCSCNAGRHSKNNMHTADCSIYDKLKEGT